MASIMLICGNNILDDFIRYTNTHTHTHTEEVVETVCLVYGSEPLSPINMLPVWRGAEGGNWRHDHNKSIYGESHMDSE
jgi:hypothetical protein